MTADPEVPPPAAGMLPAPAERRRGLALLGVGMGMAIALLAIVGFKLLRGPGRAAPPIAATLTKTLAPVVEAVKAEAPSEEPQPPAKVATAPAKAEPAPAKAAPARAKATPTPATTLAPEPGRRAPAKPIAEKAPAVSRRRAVTQKEKKANARRGAHARALAMREPAAKKTTAAAPPPERADPRPPYEHGNALLFAGDGKGAIAAYREAVRSAPTDPIGFRGLGLAYEQQGETAQAIKALRRYLKLAPDAPDHDIIARRVDKLSKRPKK
jgi:tetratricopeptide (TPR) repeat protein